MLAVSVITARTYRPGGLNTQVRLKVSHFHFLGIKVKRAVDKERRCRIFTYTYWVA